jgi:hypothetical protein
VLNLEWEKKSILKKVAKEELRLWPERRNSATLRDEGVWLSLFSCCTRTSTAGLVNPHVVLTIRVLALDEPYRSSYAI